MNSKVLPAAVAVAAVLIFAGNYYVSLGAECGRPTDPCKCRIKLVGAKKWGAAAASCSVKLAFAPDSASSDLSDCDTVEPGFFDRVVMCDQGTRATLFCGMATVSVPAGGRVRLSCLSDPDRIEVNGKDAWVNTVQVPNAPSLAGPQRAAAADAPREAEFLTDTVRVRVIDGAAGVEQGASSGEQVLLVASGEAEMESLCTGETVRVKGPGSVGVPSSGSGFSFCGSSAAPSECTRLDAEGRWRGVYALIQRGQPRRTVSFVLNIRSESGRLAGTLDTAAATFAIAEARLSGSSLTVRATSDRYREVNLSGQLTRAGMTFSVTHRDATVSPALTLSGMGSADRLFIFSTALPPAVAGQPYSYELVALSPSRGAITYRLAEGSLPTGITLDERKGVLSGTPTEAGEFKPLIRATDARGDVFDQRLTLTAKKLAVTTTLLPDGVFGQRYSTTLKAAGGRPPYRWRNEIPLPGIRLDGSTGELSVELSRELGWPPGGVPLCVSVTDQDGNTERQSLTVIMRGLTILTSHFLPEAVVGVPYHTQFLAAGASSPVSWETDALGNGFQLNPQTGELSGTPAQAGAMVFSVSASDGSRSQYREFLLQVSPPAAPAGPPRIAANGIVNGASFAGGAAVAPGSLISVFGSDLAALTESAKDAPWPIASAARRSRSTTGQHRCTL